MFLFSIGFIAGVKIFSKTTPTTSNESLQGNPNVQPPGNPNDEEVDNNDNVDSSKDDMPTGDSPDNGDNPDGDSQAGDKDNQSGGQSGDSPEPGSEPGSKPGEDSKPKKEVFLTFDDGPTSNITPEILRILDEYGVKATFFVIGQNADKYPELIKEEKLKGHFIANHTYSHDYNYIYANPANFLKDLEKASDALVSILGEYNSKIIRFPGGSFGAKRAPYRDAAVKAGYTYVDWNALNGDAEALNVPVDKLIENIKTTTANKNRVVVLMHDSPSKATTVEALPQIIEFYQSLGYEFKTLDE